MFIRRCNERCMKYQEDFQRVEREASTNFGYAAAVGCYRPYYRLCSRTTAYKIPVWLDIAYGKFEFLVLLECHLISDFLSTRSVNSAKISIKRTVVTKQNSSVDQWHLATKFTSPEVFDASGKILVTRLLIDSRVEASGTGEAQTSHFGQCLLNGRS
ncbi:hypothetical protein NA56DRAFT_651483 [Hyaloscypha hepaticicola]|uniref:Uncharacterized protein n=1 Tax=Hyaloscypha hepaticicola TaxID=2082293 RepID=A0A2J6PII4_9HELO|nr:hypothetical protein NA56DRAFT_651483 [Hyaloscypha hepaticicola]